MYITLRKLILSSHSLHSGRRGWAPGHSIKTDPALIPGDEEAHLGLVARPRALVHRGRLRRAHGVEAHKSPGDAWLRVCAHRHQIMWRAAVLVDLAVRCAGGVKVAVRAPIELAVLRAAEGVRVAFRPRAGDWIAGVGVVWRRPAALVVWEENALQRLVYAGGVGVGEAGPVADALRGVELGAVDDQGAPAVDPQAVPVIGPVSLENGCFSGL